MSLLRHSINRYTSTNAEINRRHLQCWFFSYLMTLAKQHRITWKSDHEKQVHKEGRDDGIVEGPAPTLVWRDCVKSREIVSVFCNPAKNRTGYLTNTSIEHYHYTISFGCATLLTKGQFRSNCTAMPLHFHVVLAVMRRFIIVGRAFLLTVDISPGTVLSAVVSLLFAPREYPSVPSLPALCFGAGNESHCRDHKHCRFFNYVIIRHVNLFSDQPS
jgi:hypothetical protein